MKKYKRVMKKGSCLVLSAIMTVSLIGVNPPIEVKAATGAEVVKIAVSQEGYHEKASNKDLDSFTANSGTYNYTKYHRDLINWGNTRILHH